MGNRQDLPPWQDEWSDGCSWAPDWTDSIRRCCVRHDRAYYLGGSALDRHRADVALYRCVRASGMGVRLAWLYYGMVRLFGAPAFRRTKELVTVLSQAVGLRGVRVRSWAYGGRVLAYTAHPAREAL